MTLWDFLLLLLVASIVGAIGQAIAGFSTPGCLMSAVIGFVGAIIGRWIQAQFNLPEWLPVKVGTTTFPIVWSVIGAAVLVLILRLVLGRRVVT
jgi:uncharacterized membrane protein YeaQ/YmgE (transglycosylase-associated protein family)